MASTGLHRQRLLHDIHEMSTKPYQDITFHSHENDINKACLLLTPPGLRKIHLTVTFPPRYPLKPPKITIQTRFHHPNVFGDYICASILNTEEGYTPAYTLKGIAIQLLSFFNSDKITQDYGVVKDLELYRKSNAAPANGSLVESFRCGKCGFPDAMVGNLVTNLAELAPITNGTTTSSPRSSSKSAKTTLDSMPAEVLIRICDFLESEELIMFMRSWEKIGGPQGVVTGYGVIRKRELLCFATKERFDTEKLGVGVRVWGGGRQGTIESEFDLLSEKAYKDFHIRTSVQGIGFESWLPLPISRRHYHKVKRQIEPSLRLIGTDARLESTSGASVLFAFMNNVVVKLSAHSASQQTPTQDSYFGYQTHADSSLKHASEKAIESYYHLFHLLLCVASSNATVVHSVNRTLERFLAGDTDKSVVPNLGHLLIMVLISDFDMDEALTMALIKEAVTRNVVWMLDTRGANMPELSYMESDQISNYRLQKTFNASKTSYRLLMFANLFRNTVNRGSGKERKSVQELRDELFDAYGAPPRGTSAKLARDVQNLEKVTDFPNFLQVMGIQQQNMPQASLFTTFLRHCCEESVQKGYSMWAYGQQQALELRKAKEPNVGVRLLHEQKGEWRKSVVPSGRGLSFFPNTGGKGRGRGNGGRR